MLLFPRRGAALSRVAGRRAVAALLALGVVAGAVLAVAATARPVFGGAIEASSGEQANLPEYGERGSLVVRYRHGGDVVVTMQLTNRGVLPLTVTRVEPFLTTMGLLTATAVTVDGDPLPARLGPRESAVLKVRGTFDHCAYFTERAIDPSTHARVTWQTAGVERTALVAYPQALLVRSPTIVDCPGRVLDRSAKQRNRDATITGRG